MIIIIKKLICNNNTKIFYQKQYNNYINMKHIKIVLSEKIITIIYKFLKIYIDRNLLSLYYFRGIFLKKIYEQIHILIINFLFLKISTNFFNICKFKQKIINLY